MRNSVKYGLAHNFFIESRNRVNGEAVLVILIIIAEVYEFPDSVIALYKKAFAKINALRGWTRRLGRTVFKFCQDFRA